MDTPSGDLGSSPDPLNDSSDATIALLASSAVRRVTRSQRSNSHFALDRGPNSVRSTSVSPRKRVFRLDVGNDISPQRIRVTVETEDHLGDSDTESAGAKMEDNVSRRLFNGASSIAAKPALRRRGRASSSAAPSSPAKSPQKAVATTTTKIPLRGLSDDEYAGATPRRPRGRPRRSGTPLPKIAADSRISVSPAPSTPAVEMTPRRSQKTGSSAARGENFATVGTPSSAVSRKAASKRASRATSVDSDLDSITGSRPRKRGRPRRLAMAPDEMAAIVEQQEEIESAANFYASIETDDHNPDQDHLEYGAASSPTPTTLSSVDLVKVQTPVPDFEYAPATDYNENYLSPIEEVSGIGADIDPNGNENLDKTPRRPSNMNDARVEDHVVDAGDGGDYGDESGENYGYGANGDDDAYADEYAAADGFSATHDYNDYNDELANEHEPVRQPSTAGETPMKTAALAVEDHSFDNNGESPEAGDTEFQAPFTIADAPQSEADLRSDPGLPFGHTPATQRFRARFSQSELTPSAVGSEVDTASIGAATGSEGGFEMESELDEAVTTRFRDEDTIAKGEDFSMIGMESLQTSINMSHSELPEMGETTSRIVSRTLESIRQGNDEEDSALSMLDLIQQSDPATPTSVVTSRDPQPVAGSSHSLRHPPRSSPALSQKGSPKKRAEPLGKFIARKTLHQAQSPAVPQSHTKTARVDNSQHTVGYDDSFSDIPDSVLEAAVPQTTNTFYFSQQQAELTGRMSQFQSSFKGKEPERYTERNYRTQPSASPRDDVYASGDNDATPVLGSESHHISPIPTIQTTSEHGGDDAYNDGEDGEYGDEAEEEDDDRDEPEMNQQAADITSSPPHRLVEPQQQIAGSFSLGQHLSQEGTSRATPAAVASPRHPPKAPYVASSERVDRLALPSEAFRPSLSPIMRAGRVLQSVTSDPPSPKDNEGFLRSPFRRSSTRDTRSPSNPPQNSFSGPDPEQSRTSSQPATQEMAESPEVQPQAAVTPSRPPLSASRKLWSTALAPFSGLKNLVVNGAQIVSPRFPPPASAVPTSQSPTTPGAAKRSAETAQLDGHGRGESSSRIKRLRLSSLPQAPLAGRSGSSEADPGSETGRSWRSLVFREGSVAGSITSFATKLMSRNNAPSRRPNDLEAEADVANPSGPSRSFSDMNRPVAGRFDSRTDDFAFSNDPEVLPATPAPYVQPAGDIEDDDAEDGDVDDDDVDDDDFDIWAIEASRPTPAPARVTIPSVLPEPVRDPRLVRLGARKEDLGASISGTRRYSTRPAEEAEREEFSLLDTERGVDKASQPDNSSKRPAPFNLDDFFSSPVAAPKMLPPTSESNIRLNEQSRQETLERLLERERKRDVEQAEKEGSQTGQVGNIQKAKTTNAKVATAHTLQAVQHNEESSPTSSEVVVEEAAHGERPERSDFNVAFYGEPPASTTPPRVAAGAEEERSWSQSDISEGDADSSRRAKRVPQIKNVPLRRGISRSQQARMDFLRSMRESSVNSGPDSEQSPREKVPGGEYTSEQPIFNEEEPSTLLQSFRRSAMLPSSSSEDGPSLGNRRAAAQANSRHVDEEPDDGPSYVSSQAEEAEEAAAERQPAAANESVFFEEDFAQQAEPETRWGSWVTEEGEPSYVESESSFMPPVLKPLPAKSASPTKSCLRSPAKGKTPGRVVEFASSTAAADTGEQVMNERANMQQATLQFAEHFALDTENRVPAGGRGPLAQDDAQAGNNDGDMHMTDVFEESRNNRRRNGRGYEVDEELSEMMLSDAHEISTPLAFMYTPSVQAGRPYFHGANSIPRASWRPPAAIELPPRRDWTLEDWLSMNQMLQEYRRLGPLNFKLRYMPEKRGTVRSPEWTKERPSLALQRKVVHTEKEGMLIKDWHLDIVDVFYIKAGRIWNHHYLLRRLFSLFIGEARHGILVNSELDGLYT